MQSFIYHILKSPSTYFKICEEIDAADSTGKLSPMITYTEAQQLPYFQIALKEAMRVRPAVGLNITRHVPPSGAEIDGQWYPGDTRVALNAWVLHKDRVVFGEDADVYRPERWLEGGEAKAKAMDRHMYQVSPTHLCLDSVDPFEC
jgi:cytochrome P450